VVSDCLGRANFPEKLRTSFNEKSRTSSERNESCPVLVQRDFSYSMEITWFVRLKQKGFHSPPFNRIWIARAGLDCFGKVFPASFVSLKFRALLVQSAPLSTKSTSQTSSSLTVVSLPSMSDNGIITLSFQYFTSMPEIRPNSGRRKASDT
jgi:hypothetical protein